MGQLVEKEDIGGTSADPTSQNSGAGNSEPELVKIKARIPEMHAALPVPSAFGDTPGPHQAVIDMFHTFTAQSDHVMEPDVGELVWVDFVDKRSMAGGIYIRPVAEREKIVNFIKWWQEDYLIKFEENKEQLHQDPSPGNKAGGLTTILEKSLGAVAKGGTTNLVDVYQFAENIKAKGFTFMNTPGYDVTSVTGLIAGGANMICFTTGRGSVFGCKPTPSIKLATNDDLYNKMTEDMDINCGKILLGEATIREMGEEIFQLILDVASGKQSKSEINGLGDLEFVPWQMGAIT